MILRVNGRLTVFEDDDGEELEIVESTSGDLFLVVTGFQELRSRDLHGPGICLDAARAREIAAKLVAWADEQEVPQAQIVDLGAALMQSVKDGAK